MRQSPTSDSAPASAAFMPVPTPPRFFEGFAWALPSAFSAALSSFRFEQGDVLFPERSAYDAIEAAFPPGAHAIQVLDPPRSARATPTGIEGNRRQSSWQSEVEIAWVDLGSGEIEIRRISQGKLLMLLWHGDESWLDPAREEPPLPRGARELAGRLAQLAPAFEPGKSTRSRSGQAGCRFLFVVDLASDSSRVKAEAIAGALAALGPVESIDRTAAQTGIEDAETFHPSLVVRALVVRGARLEQMEQALRGALYGGAAKLDDRPEQDDEQDVGNADDESPTTDRFSVARHGLLEELPR